jgi:hypothetical protein
MMKLRIAAFIVLVALSLIFPGTASSQDILVYASEYTDSLDIAGDPIGSNLIGWMTGLDHPGEWVEYDIGPLSYGTYEIRMAARGADSVQYHLELTVTEIASGDEQVIPFDFTGAGFGSCSCNILSVGGDILGMYGPAYKARLTTSTGGELWVYSITLPVLTSTEQITWSGIKTMDRR